MIDSYMWGVVNRISPEAPIPIVSVVNREYRMEEHECCFNINL